MSLSLHLPPGEEAYEDGTTGRIASEQGDDVNDDSEDFAESEHEFEICENCRDTMVGD